MVSIASSCSAMYSLTPFASARIAAMPMMPMDPAKAVMSVRPFLVMRLLNESSSAVRNDIEVLRACLASRFGAVSGSKGSLSSVTFPSARRTMRVA